MTLHPNAGGPIMPDERHIQSDSRAQDIAERAAARALHDTFRLLGFDIHEVADVNALRDDFRFLRQRRNTAETRHSEVFKSATSALVGGVIGMLLGAVTWFVSVLRHTP